MSNVMSNYLSTLVDPDNGLISRRIHIEPEIYQQELEQIFARCWLFLCHESQLPNPGDYMTTYMAEDPILCVRGNDGKIRAFLNSCRHRGNRVCRADTGNTASFTCAYHGWTYGNDGKLTGVPYLEDGYYNELKMEEWGLVPVTQVDSHKGLYFGTFDADAPSLKEYLGETAWYLDNFFQRNEGGIEIIGGAHKWVLPCNWKYAAENFSGDAYHVQTSHLSGVTIGFDTAPTANSKSGGRIVSPGNGARDDVRPPGRSGRHRASRTDRLRKENHPGDAEASRTARPRGQADHGQRVPEHGDDARRFPFPPCFASAGTREDRDMVLDLRRQGRAAARQRCVPPGERPGVRSVGGVRAGRHGQLAGMHTRRPRCGGTTCHVEYQDGAGARPLRRKDGRHGQRLALQRKQSSPLL